MKHVFRAGHPRPGRFVAVKFLSADFQRDRARFERFQREARALFVLSCGLITAQSSCTSLSVVVNWTVEPKK
jgi:serine/threonine protein kinase